MVARARYRARCGLDSPGHDALPPALETLPPVEAGAEVLFIRGQRVVVPATLVSHPGCAGLRETPALPPSSPSEVTPSSSLLYLRSL